MKNNFILGMMVIGSTHAYGHNFSILLNDSPLQMDWNINMLLNQEKVRALVTSMGEHQNSLKVKKIKQSSVSGKSDLFLVNLATSRNHMDQGTLSSRASDPVGGGTSKFSKEICESVFVNVFPDLRKSYDHNDSDLVGVDHNGDKYNYEEQGRHTLNHLFHKMSDKKQSHGYVPEVGQIYGHQSASESEVQVGPQQVYPQLYSLKLTSKEDTFERLQSSQNKLAHPVKHNSIKYPSNLHTVLISHGVDDIVGMTGRADGKETRNRNDVKSIDVFHEAAQPPPPSSSLLPPIMVGLGAKKKPFLEEIKQRSISGKLRRVSHENQVTGDRGGDALPFLGELLEKIHKFKARKKRAEIIPIRMQSKEERNSPSSILSQLHEELMDYHKKREKNQDITQEAKRVTMDGESEGSSSPTMVKSTQKSLKINQEKASFVIDPKPSPKNRGCKKDSESTPTGQNGSPRPVLYSHDTLLKELTFSSLYKAAKQREAMRGEISVEQNSWPKHNENITTPDEDKLTVKALPIKNDLLMMIELPKEQELVVDITNDCQIKDKGKDKEKEDNDKNSSSIEMMAITKEQELIVDSINTQQINDKEKENGERSYDESSQRSDASLIHSSQSLFPPVQNQYEKIGFEGVMLNAFERMKGLLNLNQENEMLMEQEMVSSSQHDERLLEKSDKLRTQEDVNEASYVNQLDRPVKRFAFGSNLSLTEALNFHAQSSDFQTIEKEADERRKLFHNKKVRPTPGMAVKVNQHDLDDHLFLNKLSESSSHLQPISPPSPPPVSDTTEEVLMDTLLQEGGKFRALQRANSNIDDVEDDDYDDDYKFW